MLSIILTGVIAIICLVLFFVGRAVWDWDCEAGDVITGSLGFISLVLCLGLCISLIGINSEFQQFKNEYEFTKQLVETSYNGTEYGNVNAITQQVIEVNNTIARHKAKVHNPWYNLWNSEEIANLEPISLKK